MGSGPSKSTQIQLNEEELRRRASEHQMNLQKSQSIIKPPQQPKQKELQIEQQSQIQQRNDQISGIFTPKQLQQLNKNPPQVPQVPQMPQVSQDFQGPQANRVISNIKPQENNIFDSNPQENQFHHNIQQPIQIAVPVRQGQQSEIKQSSQYDSEKKLQHNEEHQEYNQRQDQLFQNQQKQKNNISEISPYKDQQVEPSLINLRNSQNKNNNIANHSTREQSQFFNQKNISQLNPYLNQDNKPSIIPYTFQQLAQTDIQESILSEGEKMQRDPYYQPKQSQKSYISSFKDLLNLKIQQNQEKIQGFSYPNVLQRRKDLGECQFNDDDYFQGQELSIEIKAENETFYIGYKLNNQKHGLGFFIDKDDSLYEGYFINDEKSIYGRIIYRNQTYYEGQWKNDLKHGKGYLEKAEGEQYEGNFFRDYYQGDGLLKNSKLEYQGQFLEGKYHGYGVMKFTTGDKYEGDFFKGQIEGKGTYTFADNSYKKGQWKQGSLNGDGEHFNSRGERYKGQFYNGLKEGLGEIKVPGKGVYKGVWSKNKREGKFILVSQNKEIAVNFINDVQQDEL